MSEYIFTINGKDYKVNVKSISDNIAEIELNKKTFSVNIKQLGVSQHKKRMIKREESVSEVKKNIPENSKNQKIEAPLPGVILEIKVKEGDEVKEGQDLLIMEAMKMENSIQAPFSGKIVKIFVSKESNVQEGDNLIEIGNC